MRSVWQVDLGLELRLAGEAPGAGLEGPLVPGQTAMWLERAAGDGLRGRTLVLDIATALTGADPIPRTSAKDALAIARRAVMEGRLRGYMRHSDFEGGGKGADHVDPPKPPEPPPVQKTFVAIRLVTDDADQKPVPFKKYKIVLPDGSSREGMLDQNGTARVDDIDPGTCDVSFPDFDAADWKAA